MTDDTIKVTDETKERLREIKEEYYEYTTLSYSEAVDVLIAEYDDETTRASDEDSTNTVTRTSAGGDDDSDEEDDFLGDEGENEGLSAEQKAERFRQ